MLTIQIFEVFKNLHTVTGNVEQIRFCQPAGRREKAHHFHSTETPVTRCQRFRQQQHGQMQRQFVIKGRSDEKEGTKTDA